MQIGLSIAFVAAAVIEAVGLGLVLWDLADTRAALRAWVRWPQTVRPGTIRATATFPKGRVVTTGEAPSLDERVAVMERRIDQLTEDQSKAAADYRQRTAAALSDLEERIAADGRDRRERTEALIATTGDVSKTRWGTALLVVGLAVNAAAAVVAVWASG